MKATDEDLELPHRLYVTYMNSSRDYQQATQNAERLHTDAVGVTDTQLPIVLTDDEGAQIAEVLVHEAWAQADRFPFTLSNKHYGVEPADVIETTWKGSPRFLRITEVTRHRGVIECTAVREILSGYTSTKTGATVTSQASEIGYSGASVFIEGDFPLLREAEDGFGLYYGVRGAFENWSGANLYIADGPDKEFGVKSTVLEAVEVGTVSQPPDWTANESVLIVDTINTISVDMTSGVTLSNATSLDAVRSTAENTAAYGRDGNWEIIGFETATLIDAGNNTYELSNLIRGRRGSAKFMNTHTANDQLIILSGTNLNFASLTSEDVSVERYYKPVTFGSVLQNAPQYSATYGARNLTPYAPIQPHITTNASGDFTVRFTRQDRKAFDIVNSGVNDTISEVDGDGNAVEIYSVDVVDSDGETILATYESEVDTGMFTFFYPDNDAHPTFTYDATDQTTDGAVAGDTLRIYMISVTLRDNTSLDGRGDYLEVTLL